MALRKKEKDVFVYGDFEMLDLENNDVIAYVRSAETGDEQLSLLTTSAGRTRVSVGGARAASNLLFDTKQGVLRTDGA